MTPAPTPYPTPVPTIVITPKPTPLPTPLPMPPPATGSVNYTLVVLGVGFLVLLGALVIAF
jgi:hypothetical protein